MIDWNRYNLDFLPQNDGKSIDAIRVVFPRGKHEPSIEIGKKIKEKGYKVYFQAANTLAYSNDELIGLAHCMNSVKPECVPVVDTFGAMFDEDLERIVTVLDKELDDAISLGFHSHNNQQFSFSLSIKFKEGVDRTELVKKIEAANIQTRALFAGNLTRHPCFDQIRGTDAYRVIGDLKVTDQIMKDTFWVGVYPGMTDAMIDRMAKVIRESL